MAILLNHVIAIVHIIALLSTPSFYALKLDSNTDKPWFQSQNNGNENTVKLHFYVHDIFSGPNMTVYEVSRSSITATSQAMFGKVFVIDDPVTVEPDINSEELGRAQGHAFSSDLQTWTLGMHLNLYFSTGELNGSTITTLGRNQLENETRELVVVGGTGVFRNARGYVIIRTHSIDPDIPYMIFEYTLNVTV